MGEERLTFGAAAMGKKDSCGDPLLCFALPPLRQGFSFWLSIFKIKSVRTGFVPGIVSDSEADELPPGFRGRSMTQSDSAGVCLIKVSSDLTLACLKIGRPAVSGRAPEGKLSDRVHLNQG